MTLHCNVICHWLGHSQNDPWVYYIYRCIHMCIHHRRTWETLHQCWLIRFWLKPYKVIEMLHWFQHLRSWDGHLLPSPLCCWPQGATIPLYAHLRGLLKGATPCFGQRITIMDLEESLSVQSRDPYGSGEFRLMPTGHSFAPKPMRDGVTLQRRLSLVGRKPRISPVPIWW